MKIISLFLFLTQISASALPILTSPVGSEAETEIVNIYPDHENKNLFYYLPQDSVLAKNEHNKYRFSLAVWNLGPDDEKEGGGFLHMTLNNALSQKQRKYMKEHASKRAKSKKKTLFAPIPTLASTLRASEKLTAFGEIYLPPHGPTMGGNMSISTSLNEIGAKMVKGYVNNQLDFGIISYCYDVKGLSHQLDARIIADWNETYKHLQKRFKAKSFFFRASIEKEVKELKKRGTIKVVLNGNDESEEAYIQLLTNKLQQIFFKESGKTQSTKISKGRGVKLSLKSFKETQSFDFDFEIKKRIHIIRSICNPLSFSGIGEQPENYVFSIDH